MLGRFAEDLSDLQRAIRRGHAVSSETKFKRTRNLRRGVIEAKQAEPESGGYKRAHMQKGNGTQTQNAVLNCDRDLDNSLPSFMGRG